MHDTGIDKHVAELQKQAVKCEQEKQQRQDRREAELMHMVSGQELERDVDLDDLAGPGCMDDWPIAGVTDVPPESDEEDDNEAVANSAKHDEQRDGANAASSSEESDIHMNVQAKADMTPRDAALLVWATGEVGYRNETFLQSAMEAYADDWVDALGMYDLARLVHAFGKHQFHPQAFIYKVSGCADYCGTHGQWIMRRQAVFCRACMEQECCMMKLATRVYLEV